MIVLPMFIAWVILVFLFIVIPNNKYIKKHICDVLTFLFLWLWACVLIVLFCTSLFISSLGNFKTINTKYETHQGIYAMNDGSAITSNNSVNGGFFLFMGSMSGQSSTESNTIYKYIVNTENGKSIEQLNSKDVKVYIVEDDTVEPNLTAVHNIKTEIPVPYKGILKFIFINFGQESKEDTIEYYQFHVPSGSVTNQYNIDLK